MQNNIQSIIFNYFNISSQFQCQTAMDALNSIINTPIERYDSHLEIYSWIIDFNVFVVILDSIVHWCFHFSYFNSKHLYRMLCLDAADDNDF